MKSFISFFSLSQHWSAFYFLFPFYNQLGWWEKRRADFSNAQSDRGDHLPLSMVTRETAECRGRTLPECQTSWVSTGASHFLMLFNSKNTISKVCLDHESVWCKCLCESSPTTGISGDAPRVFHVNLCLSVAVSRTNGVQWMGLFFLLFLCSLLKMTEDFSLLILFVLFLFFNF